MNNIPKISLTIILEGSTLVRKSEPEVISFKLFEKDTIPNKKWRGKDGLKVVNRGEQLHYPLEAKPVSMHINLTVDAYEYMTSFECPYWAKPKTWSNLNKTQRLELHLQRMCENFNGKSFSYQILED